MVIINDVKSLWRDYTEGRARLTYVKRDRVIAAMKEFEKTLAEDPVTLGIIKEFEKYVKDK